MTSVDKSQLELPETGQVWVKEARIVKKKTEKTIIPALRPGDGRSSPEC
jgi:hypothetical protein